MDHVRKAMQRLTEAERGQDVTRTITFDEFLLHLQEHPERLIRNVHQVFHDMVQAYVGEGHDEYPGDPESINFIAFDCTRLFVENTDNPFFADRIFANRLMNMIAGFRGGTQQNKIYLFDGPPGCGKSIFLNNLLQRFEEYANSPEGCRYEVVWHLDRNVLGETSEESGPIVDQLARLLCDWDAAQKLVDDARPGQSDRPERPEAARAAPSARRWTAASSRCPAPATTTRW